MLLPYKDDNPTSTAPVVTVILIAVNAVIFLYFRVIVSANSREFEAVIMNIGLIPGLFFSPHHHHLMREIQALPPRYTLITAMFMHGSLLHLAGNMLYLWIFGNNVEDYFGHIRFLIFYLLAGILGSLTYMVTNPFSMTPMVGASGAIAGVLGAYLILFPRARVHVLLFLIIFFTTIEVPAVLVLGIWILAQIIDGLAELGRKSGGIAWFAHIGGFFAGIIMLKLIPRRRKWRKRIYD